jgi:hypothetical protein
MRTDAAYRPALVRLAFSVALVGSRDQFVSDRGFALCRQYLLEHALPNVLHRGGPFDPDACIAIGMKWVTAFVAVDRRRALA